MSQLTEQELNQIRAEAERLYPALKVEEGFENYCKTQNRIVSYQKQAHIATATLYQERAKGLLEALEQIRDGAAPYNVDQAFSWRETAIQISDTTITNYNESLKG